MTSVKIEVPLVPPSANELRRKYRNHWVYARLRKQWGESIFYSTTAIQRGLLLNAARNGEKTRLKITIHHAKLFDPDNLVASVKPILDELVGLEFLAEDDPAHLELTVKQQKCIRVAKKTVIDFGTEVKSR